METESCLVISIIFINTRIFIVMYSLHININYITIIIIILLYITIYIIIYGKFYFLIVK